MKAVDVNIKIIKDSRREDTLSVNVKTEKYEVNSSVPVGKSKGKFEEVSLDPQEAIKKFQEIRKEILNREFSTILEFDKFLMELDGTKDKSILGGNLMLCLSIAFTKLLAKENNLETYKLIAQIAKITPNKFPHLYFNLIGGGLHAQKSLPFQEYILVTKFPSPKKGLDYAIEMVGKIEKDISENFNEIRHGDEGAFAIKSNVAGVGLEVLNRNLFEGKVGLALDAAASSFYSNGRYKIGEQFLSTLELLELYKNLVDKYKLISIEDPFAEEDEDGFIKIRRGLGGKTEIIGDDLTVTNTGFMKKAKERDLVTGVIIKPNQIGTVSETLDAISLAKSYNWKTIVSHRSGETEDDFIADLAFGAGAYGLKAGAPTQRERLVKYERLIEIEKKING